MNILFVCSGNTCRSPMAEALLREQVKKDELLRKNVAVRSCGTMTVPGMQAAQNAIDAMYARGIDLTAHRSELISQDLVDWADVILTMQPSHAQVVSAMFENAAQKTYPILQYVGLTGGIADPFGAPLDVYVACAGDLAKAIQEVAARLRAMVDKLP